MADKTGKGGGPKMKLYQFPGYRSFPCLWLIYELDAAKDFEIVKLDTHIKDTAEYQEYLQNVHPHGTIPALVTDGQGVMMESTAICLYLADYYGKLAPPVAERKDYYDWTIYAGNTMDEILDFFYWEWVSPVKRTAPNPERVKKLTAKYDICMKNLTKALQGKQFLCGDSLTVPDIIVGYGVSSLRHDHFNNGCLVRDYPEVQAYAKRLEDRPAFKMAVQAEKQ